LLTNKEIKLLQALDKKSERYSQGRFIVEGVKNVIELLKSEFTVQQIYGINEQFSKHPSFVKVTNKDLERISQLKNASEVIAVVELPLIEHPDLNKTSLLLDGINDPGNLGTIIRTADWFGIEQIVCSPGSVDVYNPKVIMSTMGSVFSVNVFYTELIPFIKKSTLKSYGAVLGGEDIDKIKFEKPALIVMGSESHGISPNIIELCTTKITIPGFGKAESLNVGVATGILLREYMR
jgi:RNA methyltransferase, TrmH family